MVDWLGIVSERVRRFKLFRIIRKRYQLGDGIDFADRKVCHV